MNPLKKLKVLSTTDDHPDAVLVFFNYKKSKRSLKITKLGEVSCYHMRIPW